MSKDFCDPTACNPGALGPEGETRFGATPFDDVDDYNGYLEGSPPITIGGQTMNGQGSTPNYTGFSRSIVVQYVDENMSWTTSPTDYKNIRVTVTAPGIPAVQLTEVKVNQ